LTFLEFNFLFLNAATPPGACPEHNPGCPHPHFPACILRSFAGTNASCRFNRKRYLDEKGTINIGEIVGWISNTEEHGSRVNFLQIKTRLTKPLVK
jgi:hypothetical protein